MKKTIYIAPATKVYAVQTITVLAGSLNANGATGHATFYNEDAGGDVLTKEDNFWDED